MNKTWIFYKKINPNKSIDDIEMAKKELTLLYILPRGCAFIWVW